MGRRAAREGLAKKDLAKIGSGNTSERQCLAWSAAEQQRMRKGRHESLAKIGSGNTRVKGSEERQRRQTRKAAKEGSERSAASYLGGFGGVVQRGHLLCGQEIRQVHHPRLWKWQGKVKEGQRKRSEGEQKGSGEAGGYRGRSGKGTCCASVTSIAAAATPVQTARHSSRVSSPV